MKITHLLFAIALTLWACGCQSVSPATQEKLSETDTQARENYESVDLAAIQAGQIQKLLASATQNIDKGFRFQDSGKEVARDIEGQAIFVEVPGPNGVMIKAPLYVDWSTELSLNSYVDLANNVEGLELTVGQLEQLQTASNQIYRTTPNRNGLRLKIDKAGGTNTNGDALGKLKAGQANDRNATGDAVTGAITADWEGRITFLGNGIVEFTNGVEKIAGKLIELSPHGAASGLVKAVIETDSGPVTKIIPAPK